MRTEWNTETYADFLDELRSYADSGYRDFQVKLTPGLDKSRMLGVRMPVLRSLGKELSTGDPRGFLKVCGNDFYDSRWRTVFCPTSPTGRSATAFAPG